MSTCMAEFAGVEMMSCVGSTAREVTLSALEPVRLVVRSTFIELDEGPGLRSRFFRKSKTDSHLQVRDDNSILEGTTYRPGSPKSENEDECNHSECSTSADSEIAECTAAVFFPIPEDSQGMSLSGLTIQPVPALFLLPVHMHVQSQQEYLQNHVSMSTEKPWPQHPHNKAERLQQRRPAKQQEPKKSQNQQPSKSKTTVMVRNIPNNCTRDMLLELIDSEGFSGQYDFFYLPMDFSRRANLGYAFVNLVNPQATSSFWKAFDGFSRWTMPTAKVCEIGWSGPHQGLAAHIERYKNSPVMHASVPDDYKPMLFAAGVRQAFPPPTKNLKPPYPHIRG